MHQDALGLDVTTGSGDAVAAYDRALFDFLEYRLSMADQVKAALAADPDFVMGLCFRGYMLNQLATNQVADKLRQTLDQAKTAAGDATERERKHVQALEAWTGGHIGEACRHWGDILIDAPQDLLALRLHHFLTFWRGRKASLRDMPASVLGRLEESTPGYGFVEGMLAFGHEECGDYGQAEAYGRSAVERNDNDLWSIHAVAHVLEMQGRHKEGTEWLDQPFGVWEDRNPFKDHVWWHAALFSLELGDYERVLDVFDREVQVKENVFYLDVQNAASLLQRLALVGVDVGDRWATLADLVETRIDDHVMPFTDTQFMMGLTGAGRVESAKAYLESLKRFAAEAHNDAAKVTGVLTIPVAEALLAYAEGDYGKAVDGLAPIRHDLTPLGGSHAQQDIFQQILIDAAMRAGRTGLARSLLVERKVLRPASQWAEDRLQTLH